MKENIPEMSLFEQPESQFKKYLAEIRGKQKVYQSTFSQNCIPTALTFNDVLMVPQYSEIQSRSQCDVSSFFSKNIPLNIPIVSSPMDTVTQSRMAIEMARQGGLGILHRFMPIQDQVSQVRKVKRAGVFLNPNPITIQVNSTYKRVKQLMQQYEISSFLVVEKSQPWLESPMVNVKKLQKIVGILTHRDINQFKFDDEKVSDMMTPIEKLIYYQVSESYMDGENDLNALLLECKKLLYANKIQKIPILTENKEIVGLVSLKDLINYQQLKQSNKNPSGRLYVGAAIGANKDYLERASALKCAGCDVFVVDVANGHSKLAMDATQELKDQFPTIDIVSGSIATGDGAQNLIRSGADGIRCGIGNGSICITRVVAGSGVPQLSAVMDTAPVCSYYDIPLCSDGGNKNSGNMCKALGVGANSIMVGRMVAGCQESPGVAFNKDGKFIKIYRGMAGLGANLSKQQKIGGKSLNPQTFSSQGVQGFIPYIGPLKYVLQNLANGIRSGMSYSGAFNLKQLKQKVKFVQITNSGLKESNVHGISKLQ